MAQFVLLFVGRQAQPDAADAQTADYNRQIAAGAPHIALGGTTIVRPCLPVG